MSEKLSKSEKIAAAKKKLKEFQSKQKAESPLNPLSESVNVNQDVNSMNTSDVSSQSIKETIVFDNNSSIDYVNSSHQPNINSNLMQTSDVQQNLFQMYGNANLNHQYGISEPQQQQQSSAQFQSFNQSIPMPNAPLFSDSTLDVANSVRDELQKTLVELNQERLQHQQLKNHVSNQDAKMQELLMEIHKLRTETTDNSNNIELASLRDELQSHKQTINILVGEKAELTAAVSKYQNITQSTTVEMEELQGRLNASRHRVSVLERDIGNMKLSHEKYDTTQQKLCEELEQAQDDIRKFKKIIADGEEVTSELKQTLVLKSDKVTALEQDLVKKNLEMELCNLRIEQLSVGDGIKTDGRLEALAEQKSYFEQKTIELEKVVQQLNIEKDQSNQQYQSYVQHLDQETTRLAQELQEYVVQNEKLSKREESLVKHIGELERQIQQQFSRNKSNKESHNNHEIEGSTDEVNALKAKCNMLEEEKSKLEMQLQSYVESIQSLQLQLQEKIAELSNLQSTVERLQSETPDSRNLVASMESDKIAASRAMTQNQELKNQLDEIQQAFVQVSNDKFDLTNRLQSEQHLGREIKLRFDGMDSELTSLKDKLHFKDEEMIRLSHENVNLNKQILQFSQELDRLRHYEAKSSSSNVLQEQLMIANDKIKKLRNRIKELEEPNQSATDNVEPTVNQTDVTPTNECNQNTEHTCQHDEKEETDSICVTTSIATEEAMEKLQERFTRTMTEVANLTEEKQRLEHLVMQLQGETETIGEYVTLYQQQRRVLKQREFEKDVELEQIISDKEQMKNKLAQLNQLVEQLLKQNGLAGLTDIALEENSVKNNNKISIEANGRIEEDIGNNEKINEISGKTPTETATKILHLLSEIQDNNRNQKYLKSVTDVHRCACCYGKLETV